VVVNTRDQAAALNAAIRDRHVAAGLVDDQHTTSARAGQLVGAGDQIATRRNDPQLDVANREIWTISRVHRDGSLTVAGERGARVLTADYVREHVELGYASTVHGAQGGTATTAHLALGAHTTAASGYVGMTRGRDTNTVHLIAADLDDARDQWVDAFSRDRADLGPAHAATRAAHQAAGYTAARPLDRVLDELREAWRAQAERQRELDRATALRERITEVIALHAQRERARELHERRDEQARAVAERARATADQSTAALNAHAREIRDELLQRWHDQHRQSRQAGQVVLAGPGWLGHRILAVHRATETLARWSASWQPYLPDMPTSTDRIAYFAIYASNGHWISDALDRYAHARAEHAHPDHHDLLRAADAAEQHWRQTRRDSFQRRSHLDARLTGYGVLGYTRDLPARLDQADQHIHDAQSRLERVNRRLDRLSNEPAITAQPLGWLERQHDQWRADDAAEQAAARRIAELRNALSIDAAAHERLHSHSYEHQPMQRDTEHHGPSFGR
jgi:hypothetical protein